MLAKKALLGEQGADQALQEYYSNQSKSQQQKQSLGKIAQAINMFTDDVLGNYYQQWVNDLLDIPSGEIHQHILMIHIHSTLVSIS